MRARVSFQTNPPQGHSITTLKAWRVFTYLPNMAVRHQCAARKGAGFDGPGLTSWSRTHGTMHAPWFPSRHQDHPFITLRGIGCSSKLPNHSYRNAANILSSLRPGTIWAEVPLHKFSRGLPPDLAGYFAETNIGFG